MRIKITDTAYGGFGVGRNKEGMAVFVPHTVSGDEAEVSVTENKKSFLYAKLNGLIVPSKRRIEPECPYAGRCGGCLFAHIDYPFQLETKENIIRGAFRKHPAIPGNIEIIKSPRENYRLRATFRAQKGLIGFFAFKSNDFIPVKQCNIVKKSLFEKAKKFACANSLTGEFYCIETAEGIAFASVKSETGSLKSQCDFDGVTFNGVKYGLPYAGYNTKSGAVGVSHKSFFQANLFLLEEFQAKAAILSETSLDITELYAGSGFFTAALKDVCSGIKACEIDKEGVNLAKSFGYPCVCADSGAFLEDIKETDVLFVDPSREGLSSKVISNILRILPRLIVYVSCNPMTLARDALKLAGHYKPQSMALFDMFPDTFHIETVSKFIRIS